MTTQVLPVSDRLLNAIKGFEGFRSRAYRDVVGVLTIGYGETGGVKEGDLISEPDAALMLKAELSARQELIVEAMRGQSLTLGQLDALTSFSYNLGWAALLNSTLMLKLRSGDIAAASAEFPKWVHAGGKVLDGLVKRRAQERIWFDEK